MKLVKIAVLAAASFLAASCCTSNQAPVPAAPSYVEPAK
jgi:hypothetical protein